MDQPVVNTPPPVEQRPLMGIVLPVVFVALLAVLGLVGFLLYTAIKTPVPTAPVVSTPAPVESPVSILPTPAPTPTPTPYTGPTPPLTPPQTREHPLPEPPISTTPIK